MSLVRMMMHYGKHLGGFKPVEGQPDFPKDLARISYLEKQQSIELQESELDIDAERERDELEHLGSIGFKNSKEEYLKFPEAISKIDQTCKELVTKLYTGENAKYLVGDQKIPEYLRIFLLNMHRQVADFKITCVRMLRTSAQRLEDLCQLVAKSVFHYLQLKYSEMISQRVQKEESEFGGKKKADKATKDNHLQMFRPNLENPANKNATIELNNSELKRCAEFQEVSVCYFNNISY